MNIEEVLAKWKEASKIDSSRIIQELVRTPTIHAEFLEYYIFFKAKLAAAEKKFNTMGWVKRKYFRGELEQADLQKYGWSQWQGLKPSGSELNTLLDMDREMNDLKLNVEAYKTSVQALEYIMKNISGRDWALKSIIEYTKFQAGG